MYIQIINKNVCILGYSRFRIQIQSGPSAIHAEHKQAPGRLDIQHRRANPVSTTGNGGQLHSYLHARVLLIRSSHVSALLAVFIRIQMVQHGLGTTQATDVH